MKKSSENKTQLEELSDEQLEQAQGGASLWNGKDKFPQKLSERSSVKNTEKISARARVVKTGGGNDV